MEFLSTQIASPLILVILAFAGGLLCAWLAYRFLRSSTPMILTVMVLPAVVCAALLAINGSLGAGIAILGVFGLVRFRSMPGSGTDIIAIFYSMVIGLMMSTGLVVTAAILTVLLGLFIIAAVGVTNRIPAKYSLHIVVPEDTEDLHVFTQILEKYAQDVHLERVRTTNMGSMYELIYTLIPRQADTKEMLDAVRVHNHNLNVALGIARPENSL